MYALPSSVENLAECSGLPETVQSLTTMIKRVYTIDGNNFANLEEFWDEVSRVLIPNVFWGRNLDAFNDILYGGFGTPEEGFVLVWKDFQVSRTLLGYEETARQLERALERCHPTHRESMSSELELARKGKGETIVDWLLDIIRDPAHDDVELRLE